MLYYVIIHIILYVHSFARAGGDLPPRAPTAYVYMYVCYLICTLYIILSTLKYVYIYIYIHMYEHTHIYIYIYIYMSDTTEARRA